MIVGLGIDIVEISRVEKAIKTGNFLTKIFTSKEIEYCQSRNRHTSSSFAARFAAKEATIKALNIASKGVFWSNIEVVSGENGAPQIVISGKVKEYADQLGVNSIYVSLSHHQSSAIAQVILWKN